MTTLLVGFDSAWTPPKGPRPGAQRATRPISLERPRQATWTLPEIVARLNAGKQRASYKAVADLVGVLARGLMNGRSKSPEYSWVVAVSGPTRGWPTGYKAAQIHPDCMAQIREGRDEIIENAEVLKAWLAS